MGPLRGARAEASQHPRFIAVGEVHGYHGVSPVCGTDDTGRTQYTLVRILPWAICLVQPGAGVSTRAGALVRVLSDAHLPLIYANILYRYQGQLLQIVSVGTV